MVDLGRRLTVVITIMQFFKNGYPTPPRVDLNSNGVTLIFFVNIFYIKL